MQTEAERADVEVQDCPVTIYLRDCGLGTQEFVVYDIGSWVTTQHGVYAIGVWGNTDSLVRDVFIPWTSVMFINYDYSALAEFEAEQLIESVQNEQMPLFEEDDDA